jgi:hypothetical protein
VTGPRAHSCPIFVAVGKDEVITLPRVSATDTSIIGTPIRNLPPCRHVQRLFAITSLSAIIDFATMQGHVQVWAVALRGRGCEKDVGATTAAVAGGNDGDSADVDMEMQENMAGMVIAVVLLVMVVGVMVVVVGGGG